MVDKDNAGKKRLKLTLEKKEGHAGSRRHNGLEGFASETTRFSDCDSHL